MTLLHTYAVNERTTEGIPNKCVMLLFHDSERTQPPPRLTMPVVNTTYQHTRAGLEMMFDNLVSGAHASTLLDPSSSAEFIDSKFANVQGLSLTPLDRPILVDIAEKGEVCQITHTCTTRIRLGDFKHTTTFLVMTLAHAEVIMGNKWIRAHNAIINYGRRVCTLHSSRTFVLRAKPVQNSTLSEEIPPTLSALAVKRAMQSGQRTSVAYVSHTKLTHELSSAFDRFPEENRGEGSTSAHPHTMTVSPRHMPALKQYEDLLSKKISSTSQPLRVTHCALLKPHARLVTRTECRLSPNELADVTQQIEDLHKRGAMVPRASPHRAPVLFVKKKDGSIRMCIDH